MKINVISDLHLECGPLTLPGGDVLIIAGDACEVKNLRKDFHQTRPAVGKSGYYFWDFFNIECAKYREVIYVAGNHEFYGHKIHKAQLELLEMLPSNVTFLENQTHQIDDVLFVGATLWTDLNQGDPLTMSHVRWAMNDYQHITMFNEPKALYHKLTPEYTVEMHYKSRDYIKHVVDNNPDKKIVVVTHMAPSERSVADCYKHDTLMNGAYFSPLDELIESRRQIKVWCHGHTHTPFDYHIGETRVLCNPRGYSGYEQQAREFNPTVGFEL